ncbi:hypothetical protein GI584_03080 [Gracilibacillus salitolerans]|uniref:Zinc finger DksA/TraR C4-type domain-containing protein n=1 Tax=Gracilibacillus salitolerans TaxID=2663022 RepID=A0A5Q2TEL1_9BACI|nr:TraR/DksA C4-type zinc finger protein [Gracilibacillus salitolerans]QGH33095.1 hypothetical protein GI584_03080 [Gracilibacillus salitolerans]
MDQQVLNQCKALLEERKEEIRSQHVHQNNALDEEVGELSTFDNHPADMGTELFERQKDITIKQQLQEELADIEDALEEISRGTYHRCNTCGKPIKEERLLAVPTTRYCIDHGK